LSSIWLLCFLIAFGATTAGSICGIGGGIVIKPILDATGLIGVSAGSALSGLTVLAMAIVTLARRCGGRLRGLDLGRSVPLALGSIAGGYLGKWLFQLAHSRLGEAAAGTLQASLLLALTLLALLYTLAEESIRTHSVKSRLACAGAGALLGGVSSLLGIGGGPFNLILLSFLFGMDIREAGLNSLFVIALSQLASLVAIGAAGFAAIDPLLLIAMVSGGVAGGFLGSAICRRLSNRQIRALFVGMMLWITLICVYNILRFSGVAVRLRF